MDKKPVKETINSGELLLDEFNEQIFNALIEKMKFSCQRILFMGFSLLSEAK